MFFWTLLWVAVAVFIAAFFVWSVHVLYEQKRVWKGVADRMKMKFERGSVFESPRLSGNLSGYTMTVSSDEKATDDMRGQRFVSAIDIQLGGGMPTAAALGTLETKDFMDALIIQHVFIPEHEKWHNDFYLKTADINILKKYLTQDRLDIITSIFSMKGFTVLFIFDELDCVLRLETGNPLVKKGQLENLLKKLVAACKRLSLTEEEKKAFEKQKKAAKPKKRKKKMKVVEVEEYDDDDFDYEDTSDSGDESEA